MLVPRFIWWVDENLHLIHISNSLWFTAQTNKVVGMPTDLYFISYDRENEQLSKYGDTKTARSIMLIELKKLIEANPLFRDKLAFPTLKSSRLRTLINQRYVIKQIKAFYWFSLFLGSHVLWWAILRKMKSKSRGFFILEVYP